MHGCRSTICPTWALWRFCLHSITAGFFELKYFNIWESIEDSNGRRKDGRMSNCRTEQNGVDGDVQHGGTAVRTKSL